MRNLRDYAVPAAVIGFAALSLAGCARPPQPRAPDVDIHLRPQAVLAHPRKTRGARVRWGGIVITDAVGPVHSTLTFLAYPLSARGRPLTRRMPWGRFQAVAPGYLDPILFAQGRLVTVVGTVSGIRAGRVGQARYLYPRLRILGTHIWHLYRRRRGPHWNFGLGIGVGL